MIKFLLHFIFFVLFAGSVFGQEIKSAQEVKEVPLTIFSPKNPTPSRFFAADISMPDNFAT
ncbi:MAG: hypothetical protein FJ368_07200, partial [Pelagibacterales bacterium]|nr:hypothetical protein [Pelagibacterales bacterium]